eukprot:476884-Pleurochrysis_carterae.AAC.1
MVGERARAGGAGRTYEGGSGSEALRQGRTWALLRTGTPELKEWSASAPQLCMRMQIGKLCM